MAQKHILIVEQSNGNLIKSDGGPAVLEHGEKSRLATYRNGVVRGLLMAGFKITRGFMDSDILAKDDVRYQIYLISETEWKDW
jgi:hypothetical protein